MEKKTIKVLLPDKMLKYNVVIVIIITTIFGSINLISQTWMIAGIIFGIGVLLAVIEFVCKNLLSYNARVMTIVIGQVAIILIASFFMGNMGFMFPLYLAANIMSVVYFRKTYVVTQAIVVLVTLVLAFFLCHDFAFGTVIQTIDVVKGFISMIIGYLFNILVVTWGRQYIEEGNLKADEAGSLLKEVNSKAGETEALVGKQKSLLTDIASAAANVNSLADEMLTISGELNKGAGSQEAAVEELSSAIQEIAKQVTDTYKETDLATNSSGHTKDCADNANLLMLQLNDAMQQILKTASEINSIVKAIDDISERTNLVAINASIEAARAGAAGAGFSIVAGEVRSLANQSSEAAKNSAGLIENVNAVINQGIGISKNATETMTEAVNLSKETNEHMNRIKDMTKKQGDVLSGFVSSVDLLSQIAVQNVHMAEQATTLSEKLADESKTLDDLT